MGGQHLDAMGFSLAVTCVPAFAMAVGSFALTQVDVSVRVGAALQNLAAGLLLGAVASELFPLLAEPHSAAGTGGLTIGFAMGLSVTYGTEALGGWLEARAESAEKEGQPEEVDEEHLYATRSSELLSLTHRDHIREHLQELVDSISTVEGRAQKLLSPIIAVEEEEQLSEAIDEQIHQLHYKLDHTRRLLEGSESGSKHTPVSADKEALLARVKEIKSHVCHLQEHFGATAFDVPTILEVHKHMTELDGMLSNFHIEVQAGTTYWRMRGGGPEPAAGSRLPLSLLAAVYVDSFIDGFLIGISCVFSQHAGLVLAAANVMEMGFVGATFANTVSRCTGASRRTRLVAIYTAPPILLAGAAIGAALGTTSKHTPAVFTGFVAFGVVALLFLVTNELLIEAHEAMKESELAAINMVFFLGIYLVLLFNRYLPGG